MGKSILFILFIQIIAFASCESKKNAKTSSLKFDSTAKLRSTVKVDTSYAMIYELKNDSIQIIAGINQIDSLNIAFVLKVSKKGKNEIMKGTAELIRLEDENGNKYIPEGTAIEDRNQKKDYFCDSTYSIASIKINLGFGFEEDTKKRLCLTINKDNPGSKLLTDIYYTLYKRK